MRQIRGIWYAKSWEDLLGWTVTETPFYHTEGDVLVQIEIKNKSTKEVRRVMIKPAYIPAGSIERESDDR